MHQNLCRSLTTAVLVSVLGVPFTASAEEINRPNPRAQAEHQATVTGSAEVSAHASDTRSDQTTPSFQAGDLAAGLSDLVQIIAHPLQERQAATLFVNDIPVLTFLDTATDAAAKESRETLTTDESTAHEPAARAATVARQIDQFHQTVGNPEAVGVRWDTDLEEYVITLEGESLVVVDEVTMLPDTTGDAANDALQATNRLRRLLGRAEPLTEIEGRPEPDAIAAAYNWDVTSVFTGRASWYGPGFHGRRTASGEVFNQNALTAAHRTLPFGTQVRVTNLSNNRQVVVRINDRGPFSHGRVLDLSAGAAREIGLHRAGVGSVRVEVLSGEGLSL